MNILLRRLGAGALGLLLVSVLNSCLVPDVGYVGGVYVEPGYEYGGWGPGYHVGPPRGGERRGERPSSHAYRPAPRTRPAPSIPTRQHDRGR